MRKYLFILIIYCIFSDTSAGILIPADDTDIQYFGRWDFSDPEAPSHSWPGVYIYAEFEGTSIGVKLKDNFCYFNVYIDGEFIKVFKGDSDASKEYTLISGLSDSSHTILFSKRNETNWTRFYFQGFIVDDGKELLPPKAEPLRKIEFVGNSITCASGNEYHSPGLADDVAFYTNIDKGFGPVIARHYDAQYTMTSISGWGMVLDWVGSWDNNLPDVFDQTHIHIPEPLWDFEQWIPNIVVIALGTNDFSGFGGWEGSLSQDETDLFKERYHQFIATINDVYPGVKVLAVASYIEWMRQTISEIVEEEKSVGHDNVFYAQWSYYEGGYVHDGHPNVATHDSIAHELISYIDLIEPWEAYIDSLPPYFTELPQSPSIVYEKEIEIVVETDSYSIVKFSRADKSYEDMEHTFTVTGKRKHSVIVNGEHGDQINLYLRAADLSGNAMQTSAELAFEIDTTKKILNWTDIDYDDADWKIGRTPIGFGNLSGLNTISDTVITLYVRRVFNIGDTSAIAGLGVFFKGQDGIILYLNGTEIGRENIFDDEDISDSTYAMEAKSTNKMFTVNEPEISQILSEGSNLLAAEIHIARTGSNGIKFESQAIDDKYQVLFPFGSEWRFYDVGNRPEDKIVDISTGLVNQYDQPFRFHLHQNYPNPFNPMTVISYWLSAPGQVDLSIYNTYGQKVCTLVSEKQMAGSHSVQWNASAFASGVYFFKLSTDQQWTQIKKLVLLK